MLPINFDGANYHRHRTGKNIIAPKFHAYVGFSKEYGIFFKSLWVPSAKELEDLKAGIPIKVTILNNPNNNNLPYIDVHVGDR